MFKNYSEMSYQERIRYKPSEKTKILRAIRMFINDFIMNYNEHKL
jgi:hypothetical protein